MVALFNSESKDSQMENKASMQMAEYAARTATKTMGQPPPAQTSNAAPVDSLTASMTVGPRGPLVLQDFVLLDHMAHFDQERIPERVVHAKGGGAFGYFEVTTDFMKKHCRAEMFAKTGQRTPLLVRFSRVGDNSGSADTLRDPRGFAIKFYTSQGNWDLVGNNTPIFFIRDPILFPSFIHSQKRNPVTHLKDPNAFWDFAGLRPETVHQMSFLFSDRGIPDGFRYLNGYGSHTFKTVNAEGEPSYVKIHWKPDQGIKTLSVEEAVRLAGESPDYAIRDLYNAIANGDYPSWTMYLQVMSLEEASKAPFNPFDVTKVWPHADYPLNEVGKIVLDRNPDNYFAQIEQAAFSPSNLIPGIEPSPDKMLQARLFSYPDTQRHRLGTNYPVSIPVNRPLNGDPSFYQQDGPVQATANGAGKPNYFPNSFQGPQPTSAAKWHVDTIDTGGEANEGATSKEAPFEVQRFETGDEDNFSQCQVFYRKVLDEGARERLTDNIANHLALVTDPGIRQRAIDMFSKVDAEYGQKVAEKVKNCKNPTGAAK